MTEVNPENETRRSNKSRRTSEEDPVKNRRQDALKLEKQVQKKIYPRPVVDDECLDDISELMTKMGVKEKWMPLGTLSVKFSPLFGTDEIESDMGNVVATQLQCITAMKIYEAKSLEELRLEDHLAGYRYTGEPTGRFLFKKSTMKNADINNEWTRTGTLQVPFELVENVAKDHEGGMMAEHTTLHHCITTMSEYQKKSLEELRFEDYTSGVFAAKSKFFIDARPSKNWHEDLGGLFNFNSEGTAKFEFKPRYYLWDQLPANEHDIGESEDGPEHHGFHYQSIISMSEYGSQSFEELRLKDYLGQRRGPRGPMYKASEEELMQLKVHYDMKVCIFIKRGGIELKEIGIIKFIGRMPDRVFGKFYVGIDLERPVGEGDGRYKETRLFQTERNHAQIVPLGAVLPVELFEEFHADDSDIEDEVRESMIEQGMPSNFRGLSGDQQLCIMCLLRPVEIVLSPCGHAFCCNDCSLRLSNCSMCRRMISEKRRVFLP